MLAVYHCYVNEHPVSLPACWLKNAHRCLYNSIQQSLSFERLQTIQVRPLIRDRLSNLVIRHQLYDYYLLLMLSFDEALVLVLRVLENLLLLKIPTC